MKNSGAGLPKDSTGIAKRFAVNPAARTDGFCHTSNLPNQSSPKSSLGRTAADWHLTKQRVVFQERFNGETGGSSPSRLLKGASPVREAWNSSSTLKVQPTSRSDFNQQ